MTKEIKVLKISMNIVHSLRGLYVQDFSVVTVKNGIMHKESMYNQHTHRTEMIFLSVTLKLYRN